MSTLDMHLSFAATSAAGPMVMRPTREPVLVGYMLAGLATSTASGLSPEIVLARQPAVDQTTSGATVSAAALSGATIGDLRRVSGFTWDQLARLFNVSRRSLHFWASGKPMTPSNEEHLQRLLAVVRKIDRGSASANRALLLGVREDGSIPFDCLAARDYDRVVSLLGPGDTRRMSPPSLSEEARAARAPRPAEELVGALQDRIHRDVATGRAARSVRGRSGRRD